MKELDRKSEMVYRWVRAYIEENKFSSNTKIPSETVLTRKLSVSRETVRRALSRLAEEDLLLRVKGRLCPGNWEAAGEGQKSD